MEELLKFVEKEIDRVGKMKLYGMDENGEEVECFDGECIFYDGQVSGMYEAYTDVRDKILELIK